MVVRYIMDKILYGKGSLWSDRLLNYVRKVETFHTYRDSRYISGLKYIIRTGEQEDYVIKVPPLDNAWGTPHLIYIDSLLGVISFSEFICLFYFTLCNSSFLLALIYTRYSMYLHILEILIKIKTIKFLFSLVNSFSAV